MSKTGAYSEVALVDNSYRITLRLWFPSNDDLRQVQQPLAIGYFEGPLKLHCQGPQVSQGLSVHSHLVETNVSTKIELQNKEVVGNNNQKSAMFW